MSENAGVAVYDHLGHPLHGRPLYRRDTRLIEAVCVHGVCHPIAESVAWMDLHGPAGAVGTWGVHGCDGCCGAAGMEIPRG